MVTEAIDPTLPNYSSSHELASLRQELLLRILLQNLLLFLAVMLFAGFALFGLVAPDYVWLCAAAHGCSNLALALQWCHHGVRTKQIKIYLLLADGNPHGWERWLPANRPARLLGSRWMISTKGVFLGLSVGMICLATLLAPAANMLALAASVGLLAASAAFLFTNPKE